MSGSSSAPLGTQIAGKGRWAQLWLGVLCMMLIANLQYAWTLFVVSDARGPWRALADIQWAFTIFHRHRDMDHAVRRLRGGQTWDHGDGPKPDDSARRHRRRHRLGS